MGNKGDGGRDRKQMGKILGKIQGSCREKMGKGIGTIMENLWAKRGESYRESSGV